MYALRQDGTQLRRLRRAAKTTQTMPHMRLETWTSDELSSLRTLAGMGQTTEDATPTSRVESRKSRIRYAGRLIPHVSLVIAVIHRTTSLESLETNRGVMLRRSIFTCTFTMTHSFRLIRTATIMHYSSFIHFWLIYDSVVMTPSLWLIIYDSYTCI